MDTYSEFGGLLRSVRQERQLSAAELARKANVSKSCLSMIEKGARGIGLSVNNALISVLNLTEDERFRWDDAVNRQSRTAKEREEDELCHYLDLPGGELSRYNSEEIIKAHIAMIMQPNSPILQKVKGITPISKDEWNLINRKQETPEPAGIQPSIVHSLL